MSGWPSVSRAEENRISESLRRADADVASSLYEAYADRLNDYAASLLGDQDAAAEVVHDVFVTAITRGSRLKDPARLRAWLYALTRFHCLLRPRASRAAARRDSAAAGIDGATAETAALETPSAAWPVAEAYAGSGRHSRGVRDGEPAPGRPGTWPGAAAWQNPRPRPAGTIAWTGDRTGAAAAGTAVGADARTTAALAVGGPSAAPADDAAADDPELEALVHQALGELDRPDREVLELTARHGLSTAEAGAVTGATSRQTAARLAQARDHLENAAAAVVLARTGRAHCPDLSAMLDSWEGPLTEPLRKRLARHISSCEVCTEGRRRRVSAERLLARVPVAYAPLSLRRRVLDTCRGPEHAASRAAIAPGEEHFDRDGFPIMPDRRHGSRKGRAGRGRDGAGRRAVRLPVLPRRPLTTVFSALACVGVAIGVVIGAAGLDSPSSRERAQALVPPAPGPTTRPTGEGGSGGDEDLAPTGDPDPGTADPDSGPDSGLDSGPDSGAPGAGPARPSASSTAAATTPPATRPASRPSSRPVATRPAAARFEVSCPVTLSANRAGVIRVTARNAPIAWRATAADGLVLTPARGRLKAGASARLAVGTDEVAAGSGVIRFESSGGARTCRISWDGEDPPPASESPEDDAPPADAPATGAPNELPDADTANEKITARDNA